MSQTKLHKLSVKSKTPGKVSVGANTLVELDGKPLEGVKFLKMEFHSRRVTKVQLEMYVEVENIDVDVPLNMQEVKAVSSNYIAASYTSDTAEEDLSEDTSYVEKID